MTELARHCDRCFDADGQPLHGKPCPATCEVGEIDIDQRYRTGPRRGELVSDDEWSLEQLAALGDARRRAAAMDDEACDVAVDVTTGTVEFDE